MADIDRPGRRRLRWLGEYVLGLGVGPLVALYGVYSAVMGRSMLPGLGAQPYAFEGRLGLDLAAAYLAGGLYLILRLYVHRRCRSESAWAQVYVAENALLIVFIGTVVYLLVAVGSVGG